MSTTSYNIYQQITSVRLATTANLAGNYFNGQINNGVDATLTALSAGALVVDGIPVQIGDRLLLKNQTNTSQNGIYFVQTPGSATSLWMIQRAPDFQSVEQLKVGQYFSVGAGNTLAGSIFVLIEPLPNQIGTGAGTFNFVNVSGGGGGGPFLAIANNLSDLGNQLTAYQNFGMGERSQITYTDADFPVVLTNPCPNIITLNCSSPGHVLQLPNAQGVDSFQLFNGPEIFNIGSQRVDIVSFLGIPQTPSLPGSDFEYLLVDKSTTGGLWDPRGHVNTINGLTGNVVLTSSLDTVYVSNSGVDAPGNGTVLVPYATLSFALSQITTASSSNPFQIQVTTGVYTETNLALKPWVYIQGNNSQLTVSGSFGLDGSWVGGGGQVSFGGFNVLSLPATVTLDFTGSTGSVFKFSDNLESGSITFNIIGDPANGAVILVENNINFAGSWTYNITNCYGAVDGGDGIINLTHTSETAANNFNILNFTTEGLLTVTDNTTAGLVLFLTSCKIVAGATFTENGAGLMNVFSRNTQYLSAPTIDNGVGGGSVNFDADVLDALPTLANGAIYNPSSIADAMSANNYFTTPSHYTPTAGPTGTWSANSVVGNLKGIDLALASVIPGTPIAQELWINAASGNDSNAGTMPDNALATYDVGAYPILLANASPTNPYIVYIIGDSTVTSDFNIVPYASVIVLGGLLTIPGQLLLDSSFGSANNCTTKMSGAISAAGGINLAYGAGQGNFINLNIDPTSTPSIALSTPAPTSINTVWLNIIPNPNYFNLYFSSTISFQNVFTIVQNLNTNSLIDAYSTGSSGAALVLQNCQAAVQIDGTSGPMFFEFSNSVIGNMTLISTDATGFITDAASYPQSISFSGGATISQISIFGFGSTDGLQFSNTFVPSNFSLIGSATWLPNSLTAAVAGIDAALASGGTHPIVQQVWVNSVSGADIGSRNGSIDSPWATYNYALSQVGLLTPSATNQFLIHIIGQQSTSNFDIVPWVHVDGHNSGTITCSGSVINDLLYQSTNNAFTYIKNCNFVAPAGLSAIFGNATGNQVIYENCDMTGVASGFTSSSNTSTLANIVVIRNNTISSTGAFTSGFTINDSGVLMDRVFCFGAIGINATGAPGTAGAGLILNGCETASQIGINSFSGTGAVAIADINYSSVQVSPLISGTTSTLIIDPVSYSFVPTLVNGATVSQIEVTQLTDGLVLTSFSPANYSFVAGSWAPNSLTGFMKGIDNKLATAGNTLQDTYNNGTPGALGNIVLLNNANPLFIINNSAGSDQTTIVSYNGNATPSFRWGFTAQGLNSAPTAINYVKFLASVTSSTAGAEYSDVHFDAYQNGTEITVTKISGTDGSLSLPVTGGKLKYVDAANGSKGRATLVGGTVTVNTMAINTGDHVSVTYSTAGGLQGSLNVPDSSIVDGVSFSIVSSSGADTSTVSWAIIGSA